MRCMNRFPKISALLLSVVYVTILATLGVVLPPKAHAVHETGLFELEGNAEQDASPPPPEDWETLYDNGNNTGGDSETFTDIKADPAPNSIFDGGKKDIQDVDNWSGKDGSVPDKDDITNAYAASYTCTQAADLAGKCDEGDLIIYFGADRVSNVGDAFLGFWFFKQDVRYDPSTGDFSGNHEDGDTLVLVNFPQATNAVPEIKVVEWHAACTKADNNDPQPGDCAAKNLLLVANGAVCNGGGAADDACAITNDATVDAPWPYSSKNEDPAHPEDFPFETFYEGGINITRLIGSEACFASFLAESRSSSSYTASLKDFVSASFPVCAMELSKACGTGAINLVTGNFEFPYTVKVENVGNGTVDSVVATDDNCGFGTPTVLTFDNGGNGFGPGDSQELSGTCIVPVASFSPPIINGVSATAGDVPVTLASSCTPGTDSDKCYNACEYNLSPTIDVTKNCKTRLVVDDGAIKVRVLYDGTVTNTSDQPQCQGATREVCTAGFCDPSGESCTTDADCLLVEDSGTCVFPESASCTINTDCSTAPTPLTALAGEDDNGTPGDTTDDMSLSFFEACDTNTLTCPTSGDPCTAANEVTDCAITDLAPGQSAMYKGMYFPSILNSECPEDAVFMDTVSVSAEDPFVNESVNDMDSASCQLCVGNDCSTSSP